MAINVAQFDFICNTTTGTQTIATGLGFTPKAYIVWSSLSVTASFEAHWAWCIGFSDGTASRCIGAASEDGQGTSDTGRTYGTNIIRIPSFTVPDATLDAVADHSSFGSGTIEINWTDAPASAFRFYGIAFGGTDLQAAVKGYTYGTTATGNASYTGNSFQPTAMFTLCPEDNGSMPVQKAHTAIGFGAAVSDTKQFLIAQTSEDAQATSDTWSFASNARCVGAPGDASGSVTARAIGAFNAWLSNGVQINWVVAPHDATNHFFVMYMSGGDWDIGTIAKRTTTGDTIISPAVNTIKGLMLCSMNNANSTSAQSHNRFSMGAASAATASEQGGCWAGDTDAAGTSISANRSQANNLLVMATEAATHTSSTTTALANISAMDTTATLTYTTATAATADIFWLAVGEGTTQNFNGDITETALTVDQTLARTLGAIRSPSESAISVNQTLARILGAIRTPSESAISVNETIERILGAIRSPSEGAISVNQTLTGNRSVPRSISEGAITIDQTLTRLLGAIRSPSETTNVNQTLTRLLSAIRTINETSTSINQTLTRILGALRSISETSITTNDSVTGIKILLKEITETAITVNQTVARILNSTRSISEPSITVNQTLTAVILFLRSINESAITINDSLVRLLGAIRNPTQNTTINDALARLIQVTMTITEPSITTNDSIAKIAGYLKTINESTITTNDSIATLLGAIRSIAESAISINQTLTRIQTLTKTINEGTVNINQTLQALKTTYANIIETHVKWYYSLLTFKGGS